MCPADVGLSGSAGCQNPGPEGPLQFWMCGAHPLQQTRVLEVGASVGQPLQSVGQVIGGGKIEGIGVKHAVDHRQEGLVVLHLQGKPKRREMMRAGAPQTTLPLNCPEPPPIMCWLEDSSSLSEMDNQVFKLPSISIQILLDQTCLPFLPKQQTTTPCRKANLSPLCRCTAHFTILGSISCPV